MLLALLATAALASEVEAEGITLSWTLEEGVLQGRVAAPATGWVGVGFNDTDTLAGSVLILGFTDGERSIVEEHVAQPPHHPTRASVGGHAGAARGDRDRGGRDHHGGVPLAARHR